MNAGPRALPPQFVRSPEGIELRFGTAAASERLVALVYDLVLMGLLFGIGAFVLAHTLGLGALLLWFFLLRHGYFLWFETRGRGATPGKRRFHLRVIRADGGPLTTEILLARNLTREVELFMPALLLAWPDLVFAEHAGVTRVVASLWILMLLLFPLFTAERLRIGDLLAGTRVVLAPPAELDLDLASAAPGVFQVDPAEQAQAARRAGRVPKRAAVAAAASGSETKPDAAAAGEFVFTPQQLGIYGERELTVLEDLLRKARAEGGQEAIVAVSRTICRRIGWSDDAAVRGREGRFLAAFYTAQRQHLEQALLLGKRRLSKTDGSERKGGRSGPTT